MINYNPSKPAQNRAESKETVGQVLIVNDDPGFAGALAKIFLKEGFQVTSTATLNEARELLEGQQYLLLIVDVSQKETFGPDFLCTFHLKGIPLPPVILLTAFEEPFMKYQTVRTVGSFTFIKKPVNREQILTAARQALYPEITEINKKPQMEPGLSASGGVETESNGKKSVSVARVKEIRIHGRGGQGVVTAAELIAQAAFEDGKFAQAFPSFGSERMGAPVQSFVRIAQTPIRDRSQIATPDYLIVQDPTLIGTVDFLAGLKASGLVIIDTAKSAEELGIRTSATVLTIAATEIALAEIGRPIQNTTLMGALAGATGLISWESVQRSIEKRFSGEIGGKNVAAAKKAFEQLASRKPVGNSEKTGEGYEI